VGKSSRSDFAEAVEFAEVFDFYGGIRHQ
jgi:hypothetical protein